jgi:hypothetical protein
VPWPLRSRWQLLSPRFGPKWFDTRRLLLRFKRRRAGLRQIAVRQVSTAVFGHVADIWLALTKLQTDVGPFEIKPPDVGISRKRSSTRGSEAAIDDRRKARVGPRMDGS